MSFGVMLALENQADQLLVLSTWNNSLLWAPIPSSVRWVWQCLLQKTVLRNILANA